MADVALGSRWVATWSRAVIGPASRRATAVWIGAGLVVAVIFGGNGMKPHDLTELALRVPAVGIVLAVTWTLLFLPTARVLVWADGATYLRSLPGPRRLPIAISAAAMLGLQLPWLALWILGDGARGLAIVVAMTVAIAALAAWRPRARVTRTPAWRRDRQALRGVYVRALRRRAGDALVRGAGLAVLAGIAGGLLVRNNGLVGLDAAVLGSAAIQIVLVPASVGVWVPLVEAHRASAWLAGSLGISEVARIAVLAMIVSGVYVVAAAIAAAAAAITVGGSIETNGWLVVLSLAIALCSGILTTRALVWAERSQQVAARVVSGAMVVAAISIVWLGWLGVVGVLALAATAVFALATVRA
ncbi:MAG: hypothetical protein JWO36_2198 [Myxococcales bacterium]|nr:hypothetical protein [Myxococcales bacterium]